MNNKLLTEYSSVQRLNRNIQAAFPTTTARQHATGDVRLTELTLKCYPKQKLLHIGTSTTTDGRPHKQAIQFTQVEFSPIELDTTVTVETPVDDFYIQPLSVSDQYVKMRCDCLDFKHRFATYNQIDKSLVGRPPQPYSRKTTDRPEANPSHLPGLCKHLIVGINKLSELGIVR